MLHKNRRGIELQMYSKASKPVKHITYYSWTMQPPQRYWIASPKSCLICDWQENYIPCLEGDLTGISGGVSFHPTKPEHWQVILCLLSLTCCQSISCAPAQFGFLLPVSPIPNDIVWGILCATLVHWWTQLVFVFPFFQTFLQLSQVWGPQKAC